MDNTLSKKNRLAIAAVAFTNALWGLDVVAIDHMLDYIAPSSLVFYRAFISFLFLIIVVFLIEKQFYIRKKDWPRVFLSGALGMCFYLWLEGMGIHRTSGPMAALLLATVPLMGLAADRILYRKKVTFIKLAGVVASVIGVAIVMAGAEDGGFSGSLAGAIFILAAAFVWTSYIVLVKPLNDKYSLLTLLTGIMLAAWISSTVFLFFDWLALRIGTKEAGLTSLPAYENLLSLPVGIWPILVLTSLICLVFGQFMYVYGVGKLSITKVAIFENILPLVTVITSFALYGHALTGIQIVGGLIIMAACTAVSIVD